MQHVNNPVKLDGIDGPVGIATIVFQDLENTAPAKSLKRFGAARFSAPLNFKERVADVFFDILRKLPQIGP